MLNQFVVFQLRGSTVRYLCLRIEGYGDFVERIKRLPDGPIKDKEQ